MNAKMMHGFPADPADQVTLGNWRKPPFNRWSFSHSRELVPAAPIWNIEQALESPQIQARGLLRPVDDERLPGLRLPTQPVHFNGAAPNRAERAPAPGEHTELLLASWLGRGTEAIAALREAGVLGTSTIKNGD